MSAESLSKACVPIKGYSDKRLNYCLPPCYPQRDYVLDLSVVCMTIPHSVPLPNPQVRCVPIKGCTDSRPYYALFIFQGSLQSHSTAGVA